MTTTQAHKISWFVYGQDRDGTYWDMPRESTMRGRWNLRAVCSCGEFDTGHSWLIGARVRDEVDTHKYLADPETYLARQRVNREKRQAAFLVRQAKHEAQLARIRGDWRN
jgi:hypothetical protein